MSDLIDTIRPLAKQTESKILMVVLDGVGGRIEGGDVGGHQVTFMPDHEGQFAGVDGAGCGERVADQ